MILITIFLPWLPGEEVHQGDLAWVQSGTEKHHVKGLEANCIDTTGAGDLFASGFLYGISKGSSLQRCGELGNLLAAAVIEVTGPKIPEAHWLKIKENI